MSAISGQASYWTSTSIRLHSTSAGRRPLISRSVFLIFCCTHQKCSCVRPVAANVVVRSSMEDIKLQQSMEDVKLQHSVDDVKLQHYVDDVKLQRCVEGVKL